jgi:Cdc6-like AAA superfamily ATPase
MFAKINPFNPNSVVSTNLFAGRTTQVHDICKKLKSIKLNMPSSFFIHGERGIGKTALVKLIKSISSIKDPQLHDLNLLTSYYSVEDGQEISSVLQESVNKIADNMDRDTISRVGGKLGNLFKNGKFEIGAYGFNIGIEAGKNATQKEITIKDQTAGILSNLIDAINEEGSKTPSEKKDGILIIIDEIHNLADLAGSASILRNIITTLDVDGKGRISFILVGYNEDIEKFFSKDSSSRRTFDLIPLTVMPENEAMDVLKKGFVAAEITWDEEALKKNTSVAGGYPHSIQVIGHSLINSDKDGNIDQEDWDDATLEATFALKSKEFSSMYSFNKPLTVSDTILQELANQNIPLSKKELNEKIGKNVYQYLPKLLQLGAIKVKDDDKKIFLHSQLFRTAILVDEFIRFRKKEKKEEKQDRKEEKNSETDS